MKRILTLSLLLGIIAVFLSGCIVIPRYERFDIAEDTVSSIEIYDLRECGDRFGGAGFLETETPVYEIPQEKKADFLKSLYNIRFTNHIVIIIAAVDPSFSYGEWVARINYTDGRYELISCQGYGETFNESGELVSWNHFGCDDDEWNGFIGEYVPDEIFGSQSADG